MKVDWLRRVTAQNVEKAYQKARQELKAKGLDQFVSEVEKHVGPGERLTKPEFLTLMQLRLETHIDVFSQENVALLWLQRRQDSLTTKELETHFKTIVTELTNGTGPDEIIESVRSAAPRRTSVARPT